MSARNTSNLLSSLEERRMILMKKVEHMAAERKRRRILSKRRQISGCPSLSDISFPEEEPYSHHPLLVEDRKSILINKANLLEDRRRLLMKKVERMAAERRRQRVWRKHIQSQHHSSLSESDFSFFSEEGSYFQPRPNSNLPSSLEEKRTILMQKVEHMVAERKRPRSRVKSISSCLSLSDFSFSEESFILSAEEEDAYQNATMRLNYSREEVPQSDLSSMSEHAREGYIEESESHADWCSFESSVSSCISRDTEHESFDCIVIYPDEIHVLPSRTAHHWGN